MSLEAGNRRVRRDRARREGGTVKRMSERRGEVETESEKRDNERREESEKR